ncbi:MAG TPA: tyrosine-type recombinase/integrase [Terriglobales bacterium]
MFQKLRSKKQPSAVLSHEFAHSHELSGAVLSEEPDNILFRVSGKRPVPGDWVSLRLAGIQYEARAFFVGSHVQSKPMRFVRCKTTSEYEAMILTPEQAYSILLNLRESERTLTLLGAGTGLRISESLGLQWQDVSFAGAVIQVRRTRTCGKVGWPKSKASKSPVPLHPLPANSCFAGNVRRHILSRGIGYFPRSSSRASNRVWLIRLGKIIDCERQ